MKSAITKLTLLGLSENEAKAYMTLLGESPLSAYEIAKSSGIPSSKVYEVIGRLEKKQMIQSINGTRSKIFIPAAPEEFLHSFRTSMEGNLKAVQDELRELNKDMDRDYTWHIKDHESMITKARGMIDRSEATILLLTSPEEIELIHDSLIESEQKGTRIAISHYGSTHLDIGQTYIHPLEGAIYTQRGFRGFILVTDSKEALTADITEESTSAIWSMNRGFVTSTEDYIRHDIYVLKILKRYALLMKEKFGVHYDLLRDVFSDRELYGNE